MTIFDYLNDILFKKKGIHMTNIDEESSFNLYMVNRWITMYSTSIVDIINLTTNKYYSIFETNKEAYNFLIKITPKVKPRRIHYVKRISKSKQPSNIAIKQLANNLELSEREISYYITSNNINIERIKKCMEN
jgi:hypothetical protein